MIERRRFLTMSASGLVVGAAAVAVPTSAAQAATTKGSALKLRCWRRLTGETVRATDAHGRIFRLTVDRVVANQPDVSAPGESFHVILRAPSRKLTDGIYRLAHPQLGGSSDLFLVGGGATTATMSVDTRIVRSGSGAQ